MTLNAAVEASRAEDAGAGFALVAEKMRNLAMRTVTTAKNSPELIEQSVKNILQGNKLNGKIVDAFTEFRERAVKVMNLMSEIASVSRKQSIGIADINEAIRKMDTGIQQYAGTAEQLSFSIGSFKFQ